MVESENGEPPHLVGGVRGAHEVERDAYVTMKRREYLRQQMLP